MKMEACLRTMLYALQHNSLKYMKSGESYNNDKEKKKITRMWDYKKQFSSFSSVEYPWNELQMNFGLYQRKYLASHDISEIWSENKWRPLSFDSEFFLVVAQKMAKVNVKEFAIFSDHDIVIVSVADSKYISCNTISSTRLDEPNERISHSHVQSTKDMFSSSTLTFVQLLCVHVEDYYSLTNVWDKILWRELLLLHHLLPVRFNALWEDIFLLPRKYDLSLRHKMVLLYFGDFCSGLSIHHDFDHSNVSSCCHYLIGTHTQIQTFFLPQLMMTFSHSKESQKQEPLKISLLFWDCIWTLSIIRIICKVSMSCRKSSPLLNIT